MTYLKLRSAWLAAAMLLGGAAPAMSADAPRKCGAPPTDDDPVVIVDGAFMAGRADSVLDSLRSEDILSIEILCMNPRDSTFNHIHGVPVMSIWTKQGSSVQVELLAAILAAQDAHFQREGTYIDDVSAIELPVRSPQLRVSIEVSAKGWVARTVVGRSLSICYVFDGDVPRPHAGLSPRQPACLDENQPIE